MTYPAPAKSERQSRYASEVNTDENHDQGHHFVHNVAPGVTD
jgi:hypothetical protein